MPAEVVRSPEHRRSRSLGWLATAWMEHFLIHGPGDIQGRPMSAGLPDAIPLSDELVALNVDTYALGAHGRRLYDKVFFSRPKGCDKSGHFARIGMFEALGPCRFGGWAEGGEVFEQHDFRYVYKAGEPMGKKVVYPFLRIMATEEGQAGNVYDNIYFNMSEGPLREFFRTHDDVGLTRIFLPDEGGIRGEIRPCTAAGASKDGGKESWANFDETHLYITPETRRMYAFVQRNLAKRKEAQPWAGETSTMYAPGQRSVAEETHSLAKAIIEGKIRMPRLLFDHRQGDPLTDLDDEEQLMLGLREAYGDAASYMDFDSIKSKIWDPTNDRNDSRRYFLNLVVAGSGQAFNLANWRANSVGHEGERPAKGSLITLGFDGSKTRDTTGIIATDVVSGLQWVAGIWERPEGADEWEVPRQDVEDVVATLFEDYQVWRMYCDDSLWQEEVASWAGRYGREKVISYDPRLYKKMATTIKAYNTAIDNGVCLNDGNPAFARHIGNAVKKMQTYRDDDNTPLWLIIKEHPNSMNKIDLAYAGAESWQARLDAIALGATVEEVGVAFWVPKKKEPVT